MLQYAILYETLLFQKQIQKVFYYCLYLSVEDDFYLSNLLRPSFLTVPAASWIFLVIAWYETPNTVLPKFIKNLIFFIWKGFLGAKSRGPRNTIGRNFGGTAK